MNEGTRAATRGMDQANGATTTAALARPNPNPNPGCYAMIDRAERRRQKDELSEVIRQVRQAGERRRRLREADQSAESEGHKSPSNVAVVLAILGILFGVVLLGVVLSACGGGSTGGSPPLEWGSSRIYGEAEVRQGDKGEIEVTGESGIETELRVFGRSIRLGIQYTGDTLGLCGGWQALPGPLCIKIPLNAPDPEPAGKLEPAALQPQPDRWHWWNVYTGYAQWQI